MITKLIVYSDSAVVGHLWLDEKKSFCFQYDESWLRTSAIPLSLFLPLRSEPYVADESHAFFANLLPEQKIRQVIARNLGVSPHNDFGLLEKIGGDCAGAVSLYPEGVQSTAEKTYTAVSTQELSHIIKKLPQKPFLAGESGFRLSLAGVQNKLPVFYSEGQFALPQGGAPSNTIIKPPIETLDGTVENEAFCMALASAIGLPVPNAFIHDLDGSRIFAIERYDRAKSEDGLKRVHQEDFCQAMGTLPEYKYEHEGGPSFAQCVTLLRKLSAKPAKDVMALLDWLIFNFLIGNSDAHGKNISFLLLPQGPALAPFYDLLSTRIYVHYGLTGDMAMKIGDEVDPDKVTKQNWEALAKDIQISSRYIVPRVVLIANKIENVRLQLFTEKFAPYKSDCLYRLNQFIAESCERTTKKLV
ncbi:type II toxin-antitoxin system HipA family toxin [uncultured Desulfuromonas sp.]|uniref:type II toxin-antitoxin system HipA family toxin n=1 Tax=uncultured Desulfuromonas sp. TaxID=181013 RepID=UPI002AAC49B1|nr:type II toxin-antitoxin system HipA family toxin [uncultured Desulfuromonas sp.]